MMGRRQAERAGKTEADTKAALAVAPAVDEPEIAPAASVLPVPFSLLPLPVSWPKPPSLLQLLLLLLMLLLLSAAVRGSQPASRAAQKQSMSPSVTSHKLPTTTGLPGERKGPSK